jgi:lysophospholipase L1-like esterase
LEEKRERVQLFLAGDSTVAACPEHEFPMAGWGQVLQDQFTDGVRVHNEARGGKSSNSFVEEGRLAAIMERIQPGDFLFIQFGHNDQKSYGTQPFTSYQSYLKQYITGAREQGAQPVLVTSVNRRKFDENGKLEETLGDYPEAVRQLAKRLSVPVIDLWAETKLLYEACGPEESKRLFVWLEEGEHPNYPAGIQDDTHFSEYGAREVSRLVIEGIRELKLPLAVHIK